LIESGLFDKAGFKRLHVAGHPEGSKDIDPSGGTKMLPKHFHGSKNFLKELMLLWQ
jgi:methylenetetrahydrofolate reductase (NADPH)